METPDACKFFFGALGFSIAQFACTHFAPRCTPFKVRFKGKKRKSPVSPIAFAKYK